MCSITTPRAAPQRATPLSKIKKIIPLASYLNAAYKKVRAAGKLGPDFGLKTHIPFSIYLEGIPGADYIYAGNSFEINGTVHHLDELECFSGSLIKVAAMFAAFTLRREADVLRTDMRDGIVNEPLSKFFDKLAERVNPTSDAVPEIMTAARIPMVPSLRDILSITDLDTAVTFTADFRAHLRRMIIRSRDCDTAECIFRLSYPYINVKLMNEGYFHRDSMKGIWLCGDYFPKGGCAKEAQESKLQYKATGQEFVRIDTVNDCDQTKHPPFCGSAQNTTSKEMARLFLNILHEELVDPTSAHEMRLLLFEAQHGSPKDTPPPTFAREDFSFLEVDPRPDENDPLHSNRATGNVATKFTIEGVKIGQGDMKKDPERGDIQLRSEGSIIKWKNITKDEPNFDPKLLKKFEDCNLTGQAAICWQNLSTSTPNTDGIIEIINDSISNFIAQAPLTP